MKLEHKAGNEMMIDFAGKHLHITDKETGELIPVEVFVAILPCSQYTYVEACMSQKREDLIGCIANALSFEGRLPRLKVEGGAVHHDAVHIPDDGPLLFSSAHSVTSGSRFRYLWFP